jgi:hypothetical protein
MGLTGAGVKVAIVDLGFFGYQSKLGNELPSTVTVRSFRADENIAPGNQPHGTAVAEIVHEMAPAAELYLVNFNTEMELLAATIWLTDQSVDVINASWGYFASGPGDGTGVVNEIVSDSSAAGAFWAVSSGNHAQRHWSGTFTDVDSDGFHEFTSGPPADEGNQVGVLPIAAGQPITAEAKWDDPFGASCRDYDLYLLRTVGAQNVIVASSENDQHEAGGCVPGADPIEGLGIIAPATDDYHLVVRERFSPSDAEIEVFSWSYDLEYRVVPGSVLQPGDNATVTTVGAVHHTTPTVIESFSSRGPTADGRTKPDLTAPDGVANATYGGFSGTSAASPHVSGAAALLKGRLPCFSPSQVASIIETHVVDLGTAGKDSTFGSGRLSLGAAPEDLDADGTGDLCDADADGDLLLDAAETACGVATLGAAFVPERTDGPFAGADEDGDTAVDEALPSGAGAEDCDGDGFIGSAENVIFQSTNRNQDACGTNGWPAELAEGNFSANMVTIQDIASYIAPDYRLNTSPGGLGFHTRWDLVPGPAIGEGGWINLQDMATLLAGATATPPMFAGAQVFNGPACPWPP